MTAAANTDPAAAANTDPVASANAAAAAFAAAPKVSPFLWIEGRAQEAAEFYVSVFRNARITGITRYTQGPAAGSATVFFVLDGQHFTAFDGHPAIPFTPAVSFVVSCDTQAEIDHYWERLTEGGQAVQCGWLEDKFGVSWQIIPSVLPGLLADTARGTATMAALLEMQKPDLQRLLDAYERG